jgi:hypothetical protein
VTDPSLRNVLFDPRCGWVLISGGVYLGTSQVTGRQRAMVALANREKYYGLREAGTRHEGGGEVLRHEVRAYVARQDLYKRMRKES